MVRGCWYLARSVETTFFTASTYSCFLEMVAICFILEMPEVENHSGNARWEAQCGSATPHHGSGKGGFPVTWHLL